MEPNPTEDSRLVAAARSGDGPARSELARRLLIVPRLLREINRRRGAPLQPEDVEDLSQDVLVAVWQKLQRSAQVTTLDPWLYRFCQLELMNRLRSLQRRRQRERTLTPSAQEPGGAGDVESPASARLLAALGDLPELDRELIRLRHEEGLTFGRIGARVGAAEEAIKARYYRALNTLRGRISPPPQRREEAS